MLKLGNKLWHYPIYYFRSSQWVYIKMVKFLFQVIHFTCKHSSIQVNLEKSTGLKYEESDVWLE